MYSRTHSLPFASLCALIAMVMTCAFAATASANGTASLSTDGTALTFTSGSGEESNLNVTFSSFTYYVEDATTNITAGTGCTTVTSKKVSCATTSSTSITLNMGDNGDSVVMGSGIPTYVQTTVNDVGSVTGGDGAMIINSDASGTVPGQSGGCTVNGGPNYDTITVTSYVCNIDGGDKDDQIIVENSLDKVPDIESDPTEDHTFWYVVSGGDGADVIDASESTANLRYNSSAGIDILLSGQGNDEIEFGHDQDLVFGNEGNDRFYNYGGHDDTESNKSEIWGGLGDDTFTDMNPNYWEDTHYEGGPGTDRVTYVTDGSTPTSFKVSLDANVDDGAVLAGNASEGDHIHASVENIGNYSQLMLSNQFVTNDTLTGSDRANNINSSLGDDLVYGMGGNDLLFGYSGVDTLSGGNGDDTLFDGYTSSSTFDGGSGTDKASLTASSYGFTADLTVTTAQATTGAATNVFLGIENVDGSGYADTLTGNSDANKLDGKGGNDTINTVGGGADTITCGSGTDVVTYDASADTLTDSAACETKNPV